MKKRGGRVRGAVKHTLCLSLVFVITSLAAGDLGPQNVLLLVNSQSATSLYVADMYRSYYPAIEDRQVVYLDGLPDCSGPAGTAADEIITRDVYENCIAEPVRQHLLNYGLIWDIMVLVTTAGMPYRIEDTVYADVVYPAGSNYSLVTQYANQITAASVESELTCLWVSNWGASPAGLGNRIVNPFQGYRSSISLFPRLQPGSKTYTWNYPVTSAGAIPPKMEGQMPMQWPPLYGTINRQFGPGDMYLTCRLDGPKTQGQSAAYAVRCMLERSKRASSPQRGINAALGAIVIDDCPGLTLDINRIFNLNGTMQYYTYSPDTKQPPDVKTVLTFDDFTKSFCVLSGTDAVDETGFSAGWFEAGHGLNVLLDRRPQERTCQNDLAVNESLLFLCCYGRNGDEGSGSSYLLNGPGGGPLFELSNGAVFTSIESYNAATLFANVQTGPMAQGKVIDFISIGGSGAVGFSFEPLSSAAINNVFFSYNLFADENGDGRADLTFVEAAFTGIPFLSWAEVVIGDPLMRPAYGPGEAQAWTPFAGDVNGDDKINYVDVAMVRYANGGLLYTSDSSKFSLYSDLCDLNSDGKVNYIDVALVRSLNGSTR